MRILKSHPFVQEVLRAEKIELEQGKVTDEVFEIRKKLLNTYPILFKQYLAEKSKKQVGVLNNISKTPRWIRHNQSQFAKPYIAKSRSERLKRVLKKQNKV